MYYEISKNNIYLYHILIYNAIKQLTNEKLILALIKDDLINSKLINCLNEIGLTTDNYYLHLSDTIFELMGFEDNEETEVIFERYMELSKRAMFVDILYSHKPMDSLALQIYIELSSKIVEK